MIYYPMLVGIQFSSSLALLSLLKLFKVWKLLTGDLCSILLLNIQRQNKQIMSQLPGPGSIMPYSVSKQTAGTGVRC